MRALKPTNFASFIRFSLFTLAIAIGPPILRAQDVADTIKVRTRVVFLDALVKDKKSGLPISDLKPENFELFDDGKPRAVSYFSREGQARKPLALILIFDCREDGAGRYLKRPEIIKEITGQLAKLPPGDEVGIMAMNIGEDEKRVWLARFTNNSTELAAALARIPDFVEKPEQVVSEEKKKTNQRPSKGSVTITSDPKEAQKTATTPKPEAVETETIKGKNGAVVTRTVLKDGSVNLKRVSRNGKMTVELEDVYDMAAAIREATRAAEQDRPNSQTAIVWVSDGIAPIFYEDRDATEQILIRANATFNSMTTNLRTLFRFLLPVGKPIAGWMGVSLYGSAKQLAQRTGGEALRVSRASDYGGALAKIIGNLTSRYSLGFALTEDEKDDGRMHELVLRVKAPDAKGKQRRIDVSSRRGYYMPRGESEQATATK
jgi:VWFA-related protein